MRDRVVQADIRSFFDSIDQEILLELVKERVSDRRVLKLIRGWLAAGVMEDWRIRETIAGTPQGGVISPLLANIYLHAFDRASSGSAGAGPPCARVGPHGLMLGDRARRVEVVDAARLDANGSNLTAPAQRASLRSRGTANAGDAVQR